MRTSNLTIHSLSLCIGAEALTTVIRVKRCLLGRVEVDPLGILTGSAGPRAAAGGEGLGPTDAEPRAR